MYTQYFQMPGCGDHLKLEGLLCHGVWTPGQYHLHINILALKQFHEILSNSSVMIAADSASVVASVVAYTREEGGTHSPKLCMEVWETLLWCQKKGISPRVGHIPGKSNILADRLSRMSKPISTEWSLNQTICNSIFLRKGHPNIDPFTTCLNKKNYCCTCHRYQTTRILQ